MTRERGHSSTGAAKFVPPLCQGASPPRLATLSAEDPITSTNKSLGVTRTERIPGSIIMLPIKPTKPFRPSLARERGR
jgi:hypothetical protein